MTTRNLIELDTKRLLGFKVVGQGYFKSAAKIGGNKKGGIETRHITIKSALGSMVGKVGKVTNQNRQIT